MIHSTTGLIHVIAAFAALLLGAWVFLRPKRGAHRFFGYAYTVSMITMIVTSFLIYRLTGSINFLHVLAVVSTFTLGRALYPAITRTPKETWLDIHYQWMGWSYVGLFAAFIAETATRVAMPFLTKQMEVRSFAWFWIIVMLVMFSACYLGGYLINGKRVTLKNYRPPHSPPVSRSSQ